MVQSTSLIDADITAYLKLHEEKELLRFVFCGSVDDGKSTLIGRLLHDTHGIYEDQLSAVKRASQLDDADIDFSLFTDGLKAEREQGITIDVAYRYFSTAKRKFIVADTPGHIQYTRNMATGASTANVAVILIDARLGVLQQSRRHAYIASLLGIPHVAVAINKMDLVNFDASVFEAIKRDFQDIAKKLGLRDVTYLPMSAKQGDNVVARGEKLRWYDGPTMLTYLESVPVAQDRNLKDFRFPVQTVLRPDLDYRGFAGQISSGALREGDELLVLPSRKRSRVRSIDTFTGSLKQATAPASVTVRLEDEIDISRGDMLVHPDDAPHVGQQFQAMLVWMSEKPLDTDRTYLVKHTTQYVRAKVDGVAWRMDLENLTECQSDALHLNDIGKVRMHTHRPLFYDAYANNRGTGAFVVIDSVTNDTVAAGMILEPEKAASGGTDTASASQVSRAERTLKLGSTGGAVWLTGAQGPQGAAVAYHLERLLFDAGAAASVVNAKDTTSLELEQEGAAASANAVARRLAEAGVIGVFAVDPTDEHARTPVKSALGDRYLEVSVKPADSKTTHAHEFCVPGADPEQDAASILAELTRRGWIRPGH